MRSAKKLSLGGVARGDCRGQLGLPFLVERIIAQRKRRQQAEQNRVRRQRAPSSVLSANALLCAFSAGWKPARSSAM